MAADVRQRLTQLRTTTQALRLHALVDGFQYQSRFGVSLDEGVGVRSLFRGTADAALAPAGPWLLDAEVAPPDLVAAVSALESVAPAVSWLITAMDLEGLTLLLQLRMELQLPDDRVALLRLWDPRALAAVAQELGEEQRTHLFEHIVEWHLLHNGHRTHIGRHHA